MFARLENSIKTEIAIMRADLSQLLKRVEETEDKNEMQALEKKELKMQVKTLQTGQREMLYKL